MAGETPYVCRSTAKAPTPWRRMPGIAELPCVLLLAVGLLAFASPALADTSPGQAATPPSPAAQTSLASETASESSEAKESTEAEESEPARGALDRSDNARRVVERMFTDPLSGVVVNRTVTVLGKDFHQHFSTLWRQNPEAARYSISVHERPSARFGSEIWVLYRQQSVFHTFLPPARARARSMSEAAITVVLKNISRREVERLTTRNPDLGPEEL